MLSSEMRERDSESFALALKGAAAVGLVSLAVVGVATAWAGVTYEPWVEVAVALVGGVAGFIAGRRA